MSNKLNLRPLGDRIIVEPAEQEETFAGGQLVLPETAKEKPQKGTVIAIGEGRRDENGKRIQMDVKLGDTVYFAKYAGSDLPLKWDGKKLLVMKESDIIAVVEQ